MVQTKPLDKSAHGRFPIMRGISCGEVRIVLLPLRAPGSAADAIAEPTSVGSEAASPFMTSPRCTPSATRSPISAVIATRTVTA
jgi:hypothetical protein